MTVNKQTDFKVGVHVSIAGGLTQAVHHARALGCRTMQVFSKSPRGWAARPLDRSDAEQGHELRARLEIGPFAVHAAYLINLAAADPLLYERSISSAVEELERCRLMRADFLVIHVGCIREGQADSLQRVSEALKHILDLSPPETQVLLENTAGERGEVGSRFEELAELLYRVGSDRLGICLDTCHTLAAGYDVRTPAAVRRVVRALDGTVGLSAVKLIHGNDSKKGLGCHVDRHQHIGKGEIGYEGFRALLRHPRLRRIPMVLETPKNSDADDLRNLRVIRKLAKG
jgi:deoxyribonuclease IV